MGQWGGNTLQAGTNYKTVSSVVDLDPIDPHIVGSEVSDTSDIGSGKEGRVAGGSFGCSESNGPSRSNSRDGSE
jgi:hypothetical protein